jgi:perosamine synthetase
MSSGFIPHSRPLLGPEEAQAAAAVVRSGMLAQGPQVEALEHEAAEVLGTRHCVALAHGTAALHLGLVALGAGPGKTVLLPSYGCTSLLNAVLQSGAQPILVDCVPGLPDVDLQDALAKIRPDTAVALIPHLFGRPLDVRSLEEHVAVLTDGTHAPGATLGRAPAARQGKACAFSFHATKMLAAGEGGMLATNLETVARLARDLRSYDQKPDWRLRFNYKMTEVSAAMLRIQFRRLGSFLEKRQALALRYRSELGDLLEVLPEAPGQVHYRFLARVPSRRLPALVRALRQKGVGAARPVFRPLHRYLGFPARDYPHAEEAWRRILSIPLYPGLSLQEVDRVLQAVREELP